MAPHPHGAELRVGGQRWHASRPVRCRREVCPPCEAEGLERNNTPEGRGRGGEVTHHLGRGSSLCPHHREATKEKNDVCPGKGAKPGGPCHGRTAPKEEKEEANDGSHNSGNERIRLDLFCVFNHYFCNQDGKGNDELPP